MCISLFQISTGALWCFTKALWVVVFFMAAPFHLADEIVIMSPDHKLLTALLFGWDWEAIWMLIVVSRYRLDFQSGNETQLMKSSSWISVLYCQNVCYQVSINLSLNGFPESWQKCWVHLEVQYLAPAGIWVSDNYSWPTVCLRRIVCENLRAVVSLIAPTLFLLYLWCNQSSELLGGGMVLFREAGRLAANQMVTGLIYWWAGDWKSSLCKVCSHYQSPIYCQCCILRVIGEIKPFCLCRHVGVWWWWEIYIIWQNANCWPALAVRQLLWCHVVTPLAELQVYFNLLPFPDICAAFIFSRLRFWTHLGSTPVHYCVSMWEVSRNDFWVELRTDKWPGLW